jgi:hypothetical protein
MAFRLAGMFALVSIVATRRMCGERVACRHAAQQRVGMFFHCKKTVADVTSATSGTSRLRAYQAAVEHRKSSGYVASPRRAEFA